MMIGTMPSLSSIVTQQFLLPEINGKLLQRSVCFEFKNGANSGISR